MRMFVDKSWGVRFKELRNPSGDETNWFWDHRVFFLDDQTYVGFCWSMKPRDCVVNTSPIKHLWRKALFIPSWPSDQPLAKARQVSCDGQCPAIVEKTFDNMTLLVMTWKWGHVVGEKNIVRKIYTYIHIYNMYRKRKRKKAEEWWFLCVAWSL